MPLTQLEPYMSNSSANFTFTGANLGPVTSIIITGGNSDQVLQTDGTGNLTFSTRATTGKAYAMSLVFGG